MIPWFCSPLVVMTQSRKINFLVCLGINHRATSLYQCMVGHLQYCTNILQWVCAFFSHDYQKDTFPSWLSHLLEFYNQFCPDWRLCPTDLLKPLSCLLCWWHFQKKKNISGRPNLDHFSLQQFRKYQTSSLWHRFLFATKSRCNLFKSRELLRTRHFTRFPAVVQLNSCHKAIEV